MEEYELLVIGNRRDVASEWVPATHAPTVAAAQPAKEELERRPSTNRSHPDVVLARFDSPQSGAANPRQKLAQQPKADAPKEKDEALPSPRPVSGPGLTLDQAINATLLADPKIRAGLEVINQANADLLTSSLAPNPDLTVSATLLPLTRPFTIDRQGGPPQPGIDVSYPIDWLLFGKRAAAMASAAAGVRVSEADYADLVRQRVTGTATGFYDVVEAKALLDLARQDLENLRRVEAAIQKAVDLGGGKVVDLNRAHLDVIKSEQDLREAEKTLAAAKALLRAQMGRRDADPAFDVSANLDAPLTAKPLPMEEALTLAEQNRPDIRSLRLQVDKSTRDIHVEKTKAYPAVTPKIGYIRQIQEKTNGFPDVDLYEFSVDVTLPFFDRNQGNVAKARSILTQNSLNLEAGRVDLRAEIVQVVQEFLTAYNNAGIVAEKQVQLAREVRDAIEKSYFKIGGNTLLEFLDAEREFRDTYRTYISNRANYWRSVYKFNSAIGKQVLPYDERSK
jgi:cobalt-zinc-cadmium efflux system outer membrane protein